MTLFRSLRLCSPLTFYFIFFTQKGNNEGVVDVTDLDSGTVLLQHEMPMISFASGGDSDSLDYIAYVAKDSMGGRYLINKND